MESARVTVREVWRAALPEGTELLGGGGGLERAVEWATTLRTRPPAFEALKGGELALVAVGALRQLDERLDLADVMDSLADKGGVAVAVVGDASPVSLAVAERRLMPLLRLPGGAQPQEAQQAVVRYIVERRTALHEQMQLFQMELMQLALSGEGIDTVVARLASLTGRACAWHDAGGTLRGLVGEVAPAVRTAMGRGDELLRWVAGQTVPAADPPVGEFDLPHRWVRFAAPIPGRESLLGFVSVAGDAADLGQRERVGVARAASACAIELDRERAVLRARDDVEGELLTGLLEGSFGSESVAVERADRLGFALGDGVTVVVVRGHNAASATVETLAVAVRRCLTQRGVACLVTTRDGAVCVVIAQGDADAGILAAAMRGDGAAATGAAVSAGVGRVHRGPAGVRASHREAEHALRVGARLHPPRPLAAFADLGLHRLLVAMAQHPEMEDFYLQTAGALVAYDRRTGSDLMATLDAFFHCHGSPTETAERLHLHRNTVLYRLRRIEEIGGLRLDDPATRLNLQVCLRIAEVLPAAANGA